MVLNQMSRITRKPVFGASDQVRHKPGFKATENGFGAWNFGFREQRDAAKTKALINCLVIAQLICAFVLVYAKGGFLMTRLKTFLLL